MLLQGFQVIEFEVQIYLFDLNESFIFKYFEPTTETILTNVSGK